ncbi:MAG: outer membrane beta-barrel protein [Bacteroidales bacterium]
MRYLITFSVACLLTLAVSAQNKEKLSIKKLNSGIDLFTDVWQGMPSVVKPRTINQGINIYTMYTFPVKKSNFTFAIGAGIGSHNLYSKGKLVSDDTSYFSPIPVKYDKSKLNLTYLDFPLELRYKNKSEYRASIGFKLGVLISNHTKYKGSSFDGSGKSVKEKSSGMDNLENLRYGVTALAGYKWINITFFYSLSNVFVKSKGPPVFPISIGIALRPY